MKLSRTRDPFRRPSWREYQRKLQSSGVRRRRLSRWTVRIAVASVLLAALVLAGPSGLRWPPADSTRPPDDAAEENGPANPPGLEKTQVRTFIDPGAVFNLQSEGLSVVSDAHPPLTVDTSLDTALQQFLIGQLNTAHARYIGIVAMAPDTGRVLAMVGYDRTRDTQNLCTERLFPAASVFKIVTAAAAIESCGLSSRSNLTYNGRKHTLYKSQLKDTVNRWTIRTTLEKSFAQSINPVFGKLGIHYLGEALLRRYAADFGFNRPLPFEIPLATSRFKISAEPYHWAELASGFNRDTRISILHGALMAAVVLNGGRLVEPTVVDTIVDPDGRVLYESRPTVIRQVMAPAVSDELAQMMTATVHSGTSRSIFRKSRRDRVLSQLMIGGKTGSIDNRDHDARIDWFVGFARERDGKGKLAVSAVVAHEKYIGTRAGEYARLAIRHYFHHVQLSRTPSSDRSG